MVVVRNPAPDILARPEGRPAEHSALYAVPSIVAILAIFMPLGLRRVRRLTRS